jgi:hypothetical protein
MPDDYGFITPTQPTLDDGFGQARKFPLMSPC